MGAFDIFTYRTRYVIDFNHNDMPSIEGELVDGIHDKELAIIEARIFYKKYRHKNICVYVTDTKTNKVIWNSDTDYLEE